MKILTVIPLWKRPEVFKICAENLSIFRDSVSWDFKALAVICPHDPFAGLLEKMCKKHGIKVCWYYNQPLGMKLNAGVNYGLEHFEFDYLMNFGSDDLIHPQIETPYQPFFDAEIPLFGVDSLYFTDYRSGRTFFFKCYTEDFAVGAGRMIHVSVLRKMKEQRDQLYTNNINRSCDGDSSNRIKRTLHIYDKVIHVDKFPYIVDVKTNTNINHISLLENLHSSQITYTETNYLTKFYGVLKGKLSENTGGI